MLGVSGTVRRLKGLLWDEEGTESWLRALKVRAGSSWPAGESHRVPRTGLIGQCVLHPGTLQK